jgi:serine/threonine protein kinase
LHRDISIGNILINTDEGAGEGNRGILIDLDYAVRLEKLDKAPKTVVCTFQLLYALSVIHPMIQGTRRFMSRNLLQNGLESSHSYLDDLESFYYVLCWLICEYDGPGDVRTSRVTKTLPQLRNLDSKDGATKSEHIRNDFDLPIQPWFGQIFQEMAMQLHGFFHRRINPDRPTLDPENDYQEFIGHFMHAIVKLGPESDAMATQRAGPVPEAEPGALLAIRPKRKAADMEGCPDEPSRKRIAPARLQHLPPCV